MMFDGWRDLATFNSTTHRWLIESMECQPESFVLSGIMAIQKYNIIESPPQSSQVIMQCQAKKKLKGRRAFMTTLRHRVRSANVSFIICYWWMDYPLASCSFNYANANAKECTATFIVHSTHLLEWTPLDGAIQGIIIICVLLPS